MTSKFYKIFATCTIIVFLIPNLNAIIQGHESYPFTPAPMFAHYIDDETNFYDFTFTAVGDSTEKVVLPVHKEHRNRLAIKRFFFDRIYGSVEENSPLWNIKHDNRAQFEQRISNFFKVYFAQLDQTDTKLIRLEVKQFDKNYAQTSSHIVGYFNLSTKHFTQTWGTNQ